MIPAIKENFFQREIADASFRYQSEVERSSASSSASTATRPKRSPRSRLLRVDPALEDEQIARVQAVRAQRDSRAVEAALAQLKEAGLGRGRNLMPPIVEASRAYVTMGEMCESLREVWASGEKPRSSDLTS